MAHRNNDGKNERSYGCYERFPCLMTRRLDLGIRKIDGGDGPTTVGRLSFGSAAASCPERVTVSEDSTGWSWYRFSIASWVVAGTPMYEWSSFIFWWVIWEGRGMHGCLRYAEELKALIQLKNTLPCTGDAQCKKPRNPKLTKLLNTAKCLQKYYEKMRVRRASLSAASPDLSSDEYSFRKKFVTTNQLWRHPSRFPVGSHVECFRELQSGDILVKSWKTGDEQ